MENILKIICPQCGGVLSVKNTPGIEKMNVTCPIKDCNYKGSFLTFRRVASATSEENTMYSYTDDKTQYSGSQDRRTEVHYFENPSIGRIEIVGTNMSFQLKPGKNVIGRKTTKPSSVDIQIPTNGSLRMSREHIIVEVKKVPGKGFVHYVSLCKERANKTTVGNVKLEWGDCLILNNGDILALPDSTLRFVIPDDEGTLL